MSLFKSLQLASELHLSEIRNGRQSASERVTHVLRGKIINLDLPPGESISRNEVAAECGVSQTPIRDAFLNLEREDLIRVYPQSRTLVSRINIESARVTQVLRLSLELELTRQLTLKADKSLIDPARLALERQHEIDLQHPDVQAFSAWDQIFHLSFYEALGVRRLWTLLQAQSGHIDRMRVLQLPDKGKIEIVLRHHENIIAAIDSGEPARTEQAIRLHLKGTLSSADSLKERYPDYFEL